MNTPVANIFEIEYLTCQYSTDTPVLSIPKLQIRRGELIFIVGISGIGKSTFIETLGLMSNTIASGEKTSIRFVDEESGTKDLTQIWSGPAGIASDFRKKYFSFIFQQTNLMPNFTAGENVAIGMLIQNQSMADVKPKILALMAQFNLPADVFDRKVYELSGGQKQRLAFLRAVTSDFEVLFGDEPTGNLDPETAKMLLQFLTGLLKKEQKTALIVSHDLPLSVTFADRILVIIPQVQQSNNSERVYGLLNAENQLVRNGNQGWYNNDDEPIPDPLNWLRQKIDYSTR